MCKPDFTDIDCSGHKYIEDFTCLGDDERAIREARYGTGGPCRGGGRRPVRDRRTIGGGGGDGDGGRYGQQVQTSLTEGTGLSSPVTRRLEDGRMCLVQTAVSSDWGSNTFNVRFSCVTVTAEDQAEWKIASLVAYIFYTC